MRRDFIFGVISSWCILSAALVWHLINDVSLGTVKCQVLHFVPNPFLEMIVAKSFLVGIRDLIYPGKFSNIQ